MPLPLWIVLGLGTALVIAYMCAQADGREGAVIQSIAIGFVMALENPNDSSGEALCAVL